MCDGRSNTPRSPNLMKIKHEKAYKSMKILNEKASHVALKLKHFMLYLTKAWMLYFQSAHNMLSSQAEMHSML